MKLLIDELAPRLLGARLRRSPSVLVVECNGQSRFPGMLGAVYAENWLRHGCAANPVASGKRYVSDADSLAWKTP